MSAALEKVPGVVSVENDPDKRTSVVRFKPDKVTIAKLLKAYKDAEFPAKLVKLEDAT